MKQYWTVYFFWVGQYLVKTKNNDAHSHTFLYSSLICDLQNLIPIPTSFKLQITTGILLNSYISFFLRCLLVSDISYFFPSSIMGSLKCLTSNYAWFLCKYMDLSQMIVNDKIVWVSISVSSNMSILESFGKLSGLNVIIQVMMLYVQLFNCFSHSGVCVSVCV